MQNRQSTEVPLTPQPKVSLPRFDRTKNLRSTKLSCCYSFPAFHYNKSCWLLQLLFHSIPTGISLFAVLCTFLPTSALDPMSGSVLTMVNFPEKTSLLCKYFFKLYIAFGMAFLSIEVEFLIFLILQNKMMHPPYSHVVKVAFYKTRNAQNTQGFLKVKALISDVLFI